MLKRVGSILMLCVLVLGTVSPVLAQGETTGSIEGTISDSSGARVPGATIKVEGSTFNRTVSANDDGFYRVLQVPPGSYRVTVSAASFSNGVAESVMVVLGKATVVDVALKAGGVTESVTVSSSDLARIDPTDNKIQTNITERQIESLPKGTNFTSLLKVAPAVRQEPLSGQFQIDGASGSENSFIIDGQEVSNFRTGVINGNNNLPFTFVKEMQVKTSGFEAEFGGATGGVINVVTKGGENQFHGEFGIQVENDAFFAGPRRFLNTFRAGGGATFVQINEYQRAQKDDFTNYFPTGTLSGPLIRDRVWFLASYSPQYFNTSRVANYFTVDPRSRSLTTTEFYRQRQTNEYAFGRLDAAITDTLRVSGTYTWNPILVDGNIPAGNFAIGGAPPSARLGGVLYTGQDLTDLQGGRQNANNVTSQAVWTPTNKLVTSFRFSRGFLNERAAAYAIPAETRFICAAGTTVPGYAGCAPGFQNITSNSAINFDVSTRLNFEGDASYFYTGFGGRHEFKGGYQNQKLTNSVNRGYSNLGIVQLFYGRPITQATGQEPTPGAVGYGLMQRFGTVGNASNRAQSIYVQDKWQPTTRLALNLGVRFEKEDLPSFNEFAPPINFGWGDKVVPRLGAAYDLTGDGKTKLFFSYGQYTDRLKFELPRGSFGGDFFRNDYFELIAGQPYTFYTFDRILGGVPDPPAGACPKAPGGLSRCQFDFRIASNNPAADIFSGAVDPNLKPFRQTEFTGGIERQLSTNYLVSARYTYKNVTSAVEDAGFPTPEGSEAYIIGNPGSGLHAEVANQFGYVKVAEPQRRYDAMEIRVDRRFADNYFFQTNYTYSRLYGNYSGLASSDENGRTSPGVNRFFDLPFVGFTVNGDPDNGRLATDRPHVFNFYGAYNWNWWGSGKNSTEFSLFTTAQSGTPLTSVYSFYNVTTIFNGRGDLGRSEAFTQTDFAITHRIRVDEARSFDFLINIINLFNESNVIGVNNNVLGTGTTNAGNLGLGAITEQEAINRLFTGGLGNQVNAYINNPANPERTNSALGLPNAFQGGRQIRMGVKFNF